MFICFFFSKLLKKGDLSKRRWNQIIFSLICEVSYTPLATDEEYFIWGIVQVILCGGYIFYRFCELLNAFVWRYRGIFWFNRNIEYMTLWLILASPRTDAGKNMLPTFWPQTPRCYSAEAISGHNSIWCLVFYISITYWQVLPISVCWFSGLTLVEE